ncbi:MAG: nucleotide sugar dehydrogenase [Deltaproteobacteria bacterium]|nr:nucleotide sugar dehydrogenase [Deltaproteobacteria bacterium]
MNNQEKILNKIKDKTAKIGVIGLGYVGLPLVIRYLEEGFKVCGFDVDNSKVEKLNKGESYIEHISPDKIKDFVKDSLFEARTEMAGLGEQDVIIICVPTPLNKDRTPEMRYVTETTETIAKYLRQGQLVSLESTTYPGTTEEVVLPRLSAGGLKVGEDFFLVFSPEREDPGRADFTTKTIPKVVGGTTPNCLKVGSLAYQCVVDTVVEVSSTQVAEMTKLLENIYRCVNIALVNELKVLTEKMGMDIWEVIEASSTKPFGFNAFYPGPGLGGHCIPIDPFYLSWRAKQFGFETKFIELAGLVNSGMPEYVVKKIETALGEDNKKLNKSKVLILGMAYKKDVDDLRESPSLEIIELLLARGADVEYNDPHIPELPKNMRDHDLQMESKDVSEESLTKYDCVVIVTDHTSYDYANIVENSQLVVDARGATRGKTKGKKGRVVRA